MRCHSIQVERIEGRHAAFKLHYSQVGSEGNWQTLSQPHSTLYSPHDSVTALGGPHEQAAAAEG